MTNDNFSKLGKFLVKHRWAYFGFRYFGIYLVAAWECIRRELPTYFSELQAELKELDAVVAKARAELSKPAVSTPSSPAPTITVQEPKQAR